MLPNLLKEHLPGVLFNLVGISFSSEVVSDSDLEYDMVKSVTIGVVVETSSKDTSLSDVVISVMRVSVEVSLIISKHSSVSVVGVEFKFSANENKYVLKHDMDF